jgi:hypothetical protein
MKRQSTKMEAIPCNGCEDFLPLRPFRTELDRERGATGRIIDRKTD